MLITCKCLNVSIDVKSSFIESSNVDVASLNLSEEEACDSFFKEQLKEIEIVQITKQVKSLIQIKTVGIWIVEYCLNCSTNCFSTCLDKATCLVNAALITNPDIIARMKSFKDYSPIFRIIVKPLVIETNSEISNWRQSPQKVQTALTSLQQQVNEAIREKVTKTEEKIRLFTEQQYNQLDEFRDRATKEHKALAQKIYEAQQPLITSHKELHRLSTAEKDFNSSVSAAMSIPKKPLSRRKTESNTVDSCRVLEQKKRTISNRTSSLLKKNANATQNSLDSEGLFVLEGMEDSVVNETGHSEGESDTDHDDSGSHDEGIDLHRKRTSSFQLAKSLPVNVPVYSVSSTDFDKDDETSNTVDIAASIKALARSIHGDAVFGDLPRPRFSTQI